MVLGGWKKRGFTLLELLIALAVIAIIAVIALSQYEIIVAKAQAAEAKQMLCSIADAVWRYRTETGKYPENAGDAFWSCLGMQPPPSKYFDYYYGFPARMMITVDVERCAISALCKNNSSIPDGQTIGYCIYFINGGDGGYVPYDIPGLIADPKTMFKQMDKSNWKFYCTATRSNGWGSLKYYW